LSRELKQLNTWVEVVSPKQAKTRARLATATTATNEDDDNEVKPMEAHYIYAVELASDPGEPRHYKDAIRSDEREKWEGAIKSKINNFYSRGVWTKFPRSKLNGRKPLGNRWVFKKKNEQNGSIRYKGRIVVKGYVQIPGVDFTESFAPVATDATVRILFAIALYYAFDLEVIDVEAAFLEADLDEQIFIEWPDGVVEFGFEDESDVEEYCILLSKAMYGTVQAALQWFKKLVEIMTCPEIGLIQCKADPCMFYLHDARGKLILLVATHVDDCVIAGQTKTIQWFKQQVRQYVNTKELGTLKKHLGVWYTAGNDEIGRYLQATMEDFVQGIVDDFILIFGRQPKQFRTPAFPGSVLTKNKGDTVLHKEYRSLVGKILYFVKKISPVCANACRELSQHLDNPGEDQWEALERLIGYLTVSEENRTIRYRPPTELRVQDVVDSAYASNPDTRKSISAYLGTIGGGTLVNWISKGQPIVTLSSTECEYVALSDGSKETTFAQYILQEIDHVVLPSIIAEDNTGAIFLTKNKQVGSRTKHIDTRYHYIRDKVTEGNIAVVYVNTAKNPSDVLSKNVTQAIHDQHAPHLRNGTLDCWNREDVKLVRRNSRPDS
jgi:hypothetical protein